MIITGAQVASAAREWIGTPWHHQGRLKGVGVDCAGLVLGVAHGLGLSDFAFTGYGHRPDPDVLGGFCRNMMAPVLISDARLGDVLLINVDRVPQHLAIFTDLGMVHAFAPLRRVVEHRIDEDWSARIVAAFRMPGVQ